MASPNSQSNAINISPDAAGSNMNRGIQMASGSVGSVGGDAYSPPGGSAYSPPTFTYTTADGGTVSETMGGMNMNDGSNNGLGVANGSNRDRRHSDEWDASKVPPSRFQKRKGSIYSTPGSRDGHVDNNYAAKFHAKHAELGYNKAK